MSDVSILYDGTQIAAMQHSGQKTLLTAGKYTAKNIEVHYRRPGEFQEPPEKDVNFYGLDGIRLYSYTLAEARALTALPPLPTEDFEGEAMVYNWCVTPAQLQALTENDVIYNVCVAAEPADGKTHIWITLDALRCDPCIGLFLNGTALIEWGDGTSDTVTGTNINTLIGKQHHYAAGDWQIRVSFTGQMQLGAINNNNASAILMEISPSDPTAFAHTIYRNCVTAVAVGANAGLRTGAFQGMQYLKRIALPKSVTAIPQRCISQTVSMNGITWPSSITSMNSASESDYDTYLVREVFPSSCGAPLFGYYFYKPVLLRHATIHGGLTRIPAVVLLTCKNLLSCTVSGTLTEITGRIFDGCISLTLVRFLGTVPPTLGESTSFRDVPANCRIVVPYSGLPAYITATNYANPAVYTYYGFGSFADGAALPGTSGALSLTWYASLDDAAAMTNPITSGNGGEIYARYTA